MGWGSAAIIALALAAFSGVMEHRRARRTDLERVGFMPWPVIFILSLLLVAVATGLWLKGF